MIELLDVVDENNQIIGQASRDEIHRDQLRHRATHCLIINIPKDRIFLQLRHPSKDNFPNCWDSSVAGHVNAGETYLECIQRECQEELGVATNSTLQEIAELPATAENGWEFLQLYVMIHEGPFQLCAREISEAAWFSFDEVSEWLAARPEEFAGGFDLIWEVFNSQFSAHY